MVSVEQFLRWKILPRCMMLASTVMSWRCAEWFMDLDAPTAAQSAPECPCRYGPTRYLQILAWKLPDGRAS